MAVTGPLSTYPGMNSPAPAPASALVCNYCDSCVNGVTVPAKVDPGCPPNMISCASGACPTTSSGSGLSWFCLACSIVCCLLILLASASSGTGGGLLAGFALGDILGSLTH